MTKRKTAIDRAVEQIDKDIATAEAQLEVLRAARVRIDSQRVNTTTVKAAEGHPEGV
jgi:hypothetical protein